MSRLSSHHGSGGCETLASSVTEERGCLGTGGQASFICAVSAQITSTLKAMTRMDHRG